MNREKGGKRGSKGTSAFGGSSSTKAKRPRATYLQTTRLAGKVWSKEKEKKRNEFLRRRSLERKKGEGREMSLGKKIRP